MIIWLASYPKSGNTLVRSRLSAYFFSKSGEFNFDLLKNIKQFPNFGLSKNLGVDISDNLEVIKNYIYVQEELNKRDGNSIRFLKTHSTLNSINGYQFTNLKNSLGVVYIIRDPKKVVLSNANHMNITPEESLNQLLELTKLGGKKDFYPETHIGTCASNYQSWKEFNKFEKYLLIKFEDLISKPERTLMLMLEFVHKLTKTKFILDKIKFKKVLETTSFEYMKNLEKKTFFSEAVKDSKGEYRTFFKYGKKNIGDLSIDMRTKLEKNFRAELKELGYI